MASVIKLYENVAEFWIPSYYFIIWVNKVLGFRYLSSYNDDVMMICLLIRRLNHSHMILDIIPSHGVVRAIHLFRFHDFMIPHMLYVQPTSINKLINTANCLSFVKLTRSLGL